MPKYDLRKKENDLELCIDNKAICTLKNIPKGAFNREDGESVKINEFYMAEFPVSQEFYKIVTGKNPSRFTGMQHPVERISWYDAIRFCGKINEEIKELNNSELLKFNVLKEKELDSFGLNPTSLGFRLPTESEWEYAARGNKVYKYSGSDILDLVGWYYENSGHETKPVGRKFPNTFGLYDMSGNVLEWCWDWYGEYNKNELNNPVGAKSGSYRVLRGGSWFIDAIRCEVAYRNDDFPRNSYYITGFRIIFVP